MKDGSMPRKVDGVEMKADKSGMNRAWKSEGIAQKAAKMRDGGAALGAKRGRPDSGPRTRGSGSSTRGSSRPGMKTRGGSSDKKRPTKF